MTNSAMLNRFSVEINPDLEPEPNLPVKPERNLLAAVLARAICDAFGTAKCEPHIVRTAKTWIFAKMNAKRPFSFAWIAYHLDLDPIDLQDRLRNMGEMIIDEDQSEEVLKRLAILRS